MYRCLVSNGDTGGPRTHHVLSEGKLKQGSTITYQNLSEWTVMGCKGVSQRPPK